MKNSLRDACAPELWKYAPVARMSGAISGDEREACTPLQDVAALIRATKVRKKGKRNADRRKSNLPCCWHGRASSRMRTPVGVPPRLSPKGVVVPKAQLQAMLPGTWPERRSRSRPPSGGRTDAVVAGVTRPGLSQSGDAPRAPVVVPAGPMPETARARFARPPAGTALAPYVGSHPDTSLLSEIRKECN
jgi:hypothetical protein